jgi:hypothetical protein
MGALVAIWSAAKSIGPKAWAVIAAVGAVAALYLKARGDGRRAAERDGMAEQLDNVRIRNDVENDVRRAGPDAVHDELQRDWRRD